eukprot:351285-Chlamydomonas_euryale.AAC.2
MPSQWERDPVPFPLTIPDQKAGNFPVGTSPEKISSGRNAATALCRCTEYTTVWCWLGLEAFVLTR